MKSGSSSAVAFGRVLQAVRKRSSQNQADVAGSFNPRLSVAAVSMAESGNRPPKTEAMVRGYAAALELDEDALLELWWAMQGMVAVESRAEERTVTRWWGELKTSREAEIRHIQAQAAAEKKRKQNPNEDWYEPLPKLFTLAAAICDILKRLLGDPWKVDYERELGLYDPVDPRPAALIIELRAEVPGGAASSAPHELTATFACPEPVARPVPPEPADRPNTEGIPPDVAWILASVQAMPARERAAVAGFIHGLREGASLFSTASPPPAS